MNWTTRIKQLLGVFWTRLFTEEDFILAVENLHAYFDKKRAARMKNWRASLSINRVRPAQDKMPLEILIPVDSVTRPNTTYEAILNGGTIGGQQSLNWVGYPEKPCGEPDYMADHVTLGQSVVLVKNLDYNYADGEFLFYVDPSTLHLPTIKKTDADGTLRIYYKLFGFFLTKTLSNDDVAGFDNPALAPYADTVRDIKTNGATVYNAKKLLGEFTGAVICQEDGAIDHAWSEQGTYCVRVNDKIYYGPRGVVNNFSHGASVKRGDILFGSMKFFSGRETPSISQVPGMKVMTDAGELTAVNATTSAYTQSGYNLLPLTGTASVVAAYKNKAAAYSAMGSCPRYTIPSSVNPFLFITQKLRRGRGCYVALTATKLQDVDPALELLRNNMNASGILNVFVSAEGDTAGVTVSGFTKASGNAAVAVDATITIKNATAEAEVFI